MVEYKIKLQTFEGPLALLMHLIEKNQVDIYDIPIAEITEQYMGYLKTMETFNIDIASDFLVMAATLLYIKSRMLLPKPEILVDDAAEADPRQELVDRLLEYRKFKQIAQLLDTSLAERELYFTREPQSFKMEYNLPKDLKLDDLIRAFAAVWESSRDDYTLIAREEISVQDKMSDIMHVLHKCGGKVEFGQTIFRTGKKVEVVAAFLALLELIRLRRITIIQERSFAPIYLCLRKDVV